MKIILAIIVFLVLAGAALFILIYSGAYNIAATEPHSKLTRQALHTAMERSVRSHAEGIEAPALDDESLVKTGFVHYREMCVTCHGAPGVPPSEIGKGLNPEPPDLVEEMQEGEWNAAELYWITKHGIKMSGMPAFGPTHSEEELWAIVAFMQALPDLWPEEYEAMGKAADGKPDDHRHGHEHQH